MKQVYVVKVRWVSYGEYRIGANSPEEASKIALDEDATPNLPDADNVDKLDVYTVVPASGPMEDGETEDEEEQWPPGRNRIKCLKCKDVVESLHTHDFKYCKCGAVAADGGNDYHRRIGNKEDYEEMP